MNRRGFLKMAGAAPLAAPAIAQAAAQAMQPQEYFGEWMLGEVKAFRPSPSFHSIAEYQLSPNAVVSITRYDAGRFIDTTIKPDPSVIAQMAEHDLFEGLNA